jgi:hypothetical protein
MKLKWDSEDGVTREVERQLDLCYALMVSHGEDFASNGGTQCIRLDGYVVGANISKKTLTLAWAMEDLGPANDLALVDEENASLALAETGPELFLIKSEELYEYLEREAA